MELIVKNFNNSTNKIKTISMSANKDSIESNKHAKNNPI